MMHNGPKSLVGLMSYDEMSLETMELVKLRSLTLLIAACSSEIRHAFTYRPRFFIGIKHL